MMLNWIACVVGYYGLSFNPDLIPGDFYLNFIALAAVDCPATVSALVLMKALGRKWTMVLGQLGAGLACVLSSFSVAPMATGFTGKFFFSLCFTVCYAYTAELFPTSARTSAMGACSAVGRVMGAVAKPISTALTLHVAATSFNLPMLVLGAPSLLASLATLFLPETKYSGLPENFEQTEQW